MSVITVVYILSNRCYGKKKISSRSNFQRQKTQNSHLYIATDFHTKPLWESIPLMQLAAVFQTWAIFSRKATILKKNVKNIVNSKSSGEYRNTRSEEAILVCFGTPSHFLNKYSQYDLELANIWRLKYLQFHFCNVLPATFTGLTNYEFTIITRENYNQNAIEKAKDWACSSFSQSKPSFFCVSESKTMLI